MRVIIEALGINTYGGGRTATINLIKGLLSIYPQHKYLLILSEPEPELHGVCARQLVVPISNRFISRVWLQMTLPFLSKHYDIIHFTKNLGVFGLRIPYIVTIYDLAVLLYPELFPVIDVIYWKYLQKITLKNAHRIISISYQTAQDLQFFYAIPARKIEVIYPICGQHFRVAMPQELIRVKSIYHLPDYYILYVGRIDPRKNITTLIEAFSIFLKHTNFPGKLIIIGKQYKKKPDYKIYELINKLNIQEKVQMIESVPDADLPGIYTGATMAVFPSIYEGFGLAALEALSCGTPLIVNRAGGIVEVVGESALIMNNNHPEHLAELMFLLWKDTSLRSTLRSSGLIQASKFSLEQSVIKTMNLYLEVCENNENHQKVQK